MTFTVEPLINLRTLRERDNLPIKDTPPGPFTIALIMFLTSEKRTTSEIRTEAVSPKCPSFGGSTVIFATYLFFSFQHITITITITQRKIKTKRETTPIMIMAARASTVLSMRKQGSNYLKVWFYNIMSQNNYQAF